MRVTDLRTWQEFEQAPCYLDIIDEIKARKEIVITDLITGDPGLGDDNAKRARINELEYVLRILDDIKLDIELAEKDSKQEDKEK